MTFMLAKENSSPLPTYCTIDKCRLCNEDHVDVVLDLGFQPPANSLYNFDDKLPGVVPLRLGRCRSCTTIQLLETVNPHQLFSKYVWLTQTSATAVRYAEVFADRVHLLGKGNGMSILEVGSNDGTFLKALSKRGHTVLGVDPATNIGDVARSSGVPTVSEFFNVELARRLISEYGSFDIVIARNVLPHVSDLHSVMSGIRESLRPGGVAVFEFHRADLIMKELHYDSIYHEHLYLHSLRSIENIANRNGLFAYDVAESPISGGSFVVFLSNKGSIETSSLRAARADESFAGVDSLVEWQNFAESVKSHIQSFRDIVLGYSVSRKRIVGFGASARSSTLLNAAGINNSHIDVIADNNEWKQGLLTPGSSIKIVSPAEAFQIQPDLVILLAWNFRSELMTQIRELGFHGDVVVPLPGMPHIESI